MCCAVRVWGRRRGRSAPVGLSSCAPKRTACSAAACARQWQTSSRRTRPNGPIKLRMGRVARSPLTPSLPPTPPRSLRSSLTRCPYAAAACHSPRFSLRVDDRGAGRNHTDRMLATDPESRLALISDAIAQTRRQSHRRSPRVDMTARAGLLESHPRYSAPRRPPCAVRTAESPRAGGTSRISLSHSRNSRQLTLARLGAGSMPWRWRTLQTLLADSWIPSATSSPWMRLYPQLGFSAARRRISSRICEASGGRLCRRRS